MATGYLEVVAVEIFYNKERFMEYKLHKYAESQPRKLGIIRIQWVSRSGCS